MNPRLLVTILVILALGAGGAFHLAQSSRDHRAASADADNDHAHGGGQDDHDELKEAHGPHGGRVLTDDGFTLELAIFERGLPPEFRAWFSQAGQPLPPDQVRLSIELTRANGVKESFTFTPERDYARGSGEVAEPHSFDYMVVAEHAGRTHRWQFAAPEMQTTIPPEAAARAGVVVEPAGPATITETLNVYGQVKLNANKIARAIPRFGGIVREARKATGEPVRANEVVAIVETNQSLATIEVKAAIAGVIVDRHASAGETVADGTALYTIADFSEVWVDLHVPRSDQSRVSTGQIVAIHADDGGADASGEISWISPMSSAEAQTLIARVVIDNTSQRWRPGLFVKATITVGEEYVPVAVKESALQTLFDFTVVFSQHGEVYQARPLALGRRGGGTVEVLKGIKAGELYVTENSFLLKADIGKSGASHDH